MLEDFLKSNDFSAEFTSRAQKDSLAKCNLFFSGNEAIVSITHFRETPSIEKLEAVSGLTNLKKADSDKTEQITGYDSDSLPPISIYGVIVIIDKKLMDKEFLFFEIAEGKFLKIKPSKLIELNEDSEIEEISV
ncbi:MAG: YbaK/EbsC family protein [Candidatus Diapherotrites archaeon]